MVTIVDLLDERIKARGGETGHEDTKQRGYLGGSQIGKECYRELYYGFRWALPNNFEGRILRLFASGFRYEPRFIELLKVIDISITEFNYEASHALLYHPESDSYIVASPEERKAKAHNMEPLDDVTQMPWHVMRAASLGETLPKMKQFGFKAHEGHYAGSCDGVATGVDPTLRDVNGACLADFGLTKLSWIMAEMKTHGDKSFKSLIAERVKKSKPVHYAQMVQYMAELGLPLCLYIAVNKNDETLYFEFVPANPDFASELKQKALQVITAKKIPARISNTPTWYGCTFCDYRRPCHFNAPVAKNCRTCQYSSPAARGEWHCSKREIVLDIELQRVGCDQYSMIRD